jgi:hypothetical protein
MTSAGWVGWGQVCVLTDPKSEKMGLLVMESRRLTSRFVVLK